MKEIPLTKGYMAVVDDDDYECVSAHKWCVSGDARKTLYAMSWIKFVDGKAQFTYLHRFIMGAQKGDIVDHMNKNGLDCQKHNMRFCTYRENNINRTTRPNVSGFRGVEATKWNSGGFRVRVDQKHIATVSDAIVGAHIYDCIARIRHGRFARTNFAYRWPDELATKVNGNCER